MMFPLSVAINFYAERHRLDALMSSTVKIKANDTLSSTKIIAYLATFPIYLLVFTFAFDFMLRQYSMLGRGEIAFYDTVFFWVFPLI